MPTPEEQALTDYFRSLEQMGPGAVNASIQQAIGPNSTIPSVQADRARDAEGRALTDYFRSLEQMGPDAVNASIQQAIGPNSTIPSVQASIARDAEEGRVNALNDRYGTDLSWLDPSFQYQANLLGPAAGASAYADPSAIANQNAAMTQAQQFANTNLQFQSPAQQQALMQQWAGIQGGQGAPSFMGNAQQQALAQQMLGVAAPRFSGDADQRAVLNQALGFGTNTGPGSLAFDTSGRQGEQYGNLQGIIAGGGATAIEMADRARQRGDSEAWLRGQREADMADYAERGLTGSGMELQALAADRQSAAGRNSLADLEMAKALEERRLGAINSAAGLATNMRGQTIDEQGLLNNRAMTGLSAASSTANSMRDANIREQLGLNEAARAQVAGAADITGQMRTQDYNERSFLDDRMVNALQAQSDMANQMRTSQANEQIGQRNAQQSALDTFANTSTSARNASFNEAESRADATDSFSRFNQDAINTAAQNNQRVLADSYQQMMNNRNQFEIAGLDRDVRIAQGLEAGDRADNNAGWSQGGAVAGIDTATWNSLSQEQRNQIISIFQGGQAGATAAQQAGTNASAQQAGGMVGTVGTIGGAIIGGAGAGAAAGGQTAAQGAAAGAQAGSQALTQAQPTLGPSPTTPEQQEAARRRSTYRSM